MSLESGRFTILHLSDIHATEGELLYGEVDGLARLAQVGEYTINAGLTPEAILVTGDLAQRGHPGVYPALTAALRRLGELLDAPVLTVLGNHDMPQHAVGLAGHEHGHYRSVLVGRLRFVLLDSSTGSLDAEQLAWLSETLAEPFGLGTVIALHHAPVPSPLPTLFHTGLQNRVEFGRAIAGSDARLILAGHYHHPMSATFNSIPVSVGPSLAYHQVMNAGFDTVSGQDFAMFSIVHVTADGLSAAPVSLKTAPTLFTSPAPSIAVTKQEGNHVPQ